MDIMESLKQALEAFRNGDLVLARDICETVQAQQKGEPGSLRLLGQIAYMEGDREEAAALFEASLKAKPDQYSIWIKLGNAYSELDRNKDAEKAYTKAIEFSADPALAYLSRAQVRNAMGRKKEAFADLDETLKANSRFGQTYRMMVLQGHPETKNPEWLKSLEHKLALGFFAPEDAIQVHYALGASFEAANDTEKMWHHLRQANGLQKNRALEWRETYQAICERSKELFTPETMKNAVPENKKSITPIFIVGLPRSGSTLLEKMLASHPKIAGAGEIPLIPQTVGKIQDETLLAYPNGIEMLDGDFFTNLSDFYQEGLKKKAAGKAFATDKLLSNLMFLGLIGTILPWAKIVHITRDPGDVAFSIFKNYFWERQSPEFCSLQDIGAYAAMVDDMMKYWKSLMGKSIIEARYEDLVNDPEAELRKILDSAGLPWDEKCLDHSKTVTSGQTLSQDQARQPVYSSSVGIAKGFENQLKPFFDAYK